MNRDIEKIVEKFEAIRAQFDKPVYNVKQVESLRFKMHIWLWRKTRKLRHFLLYKRQIVGRVVGEWIAGVSFE